MASGRRSLCLTWSRYYGRFYVRGALGGALWVVLWEVLWERCSGRRGCRRRVGGISGWLFCGISKNNFLQLFARNSFLRLFTRNSFLQFFSISGSLTLIKPCLGQTWHRKHMPNKRSLDLSEAFCTGKALKKRPPPLDLVLGAESAQVARFSCLMTLDLGKNILPFLSLKDLKKFCFVHKRVQGFVRKYLTTTGKCLLC